MRLARLGMHEQKAITEALWSVILKTFWPMESGVKLSEAQVQLFKQDLLYLAEKS
jgi:hypothetical protein